MARTPGPREAAASPAPAGPGDAADSPPGPGGGPRPRFLGHLLSDVERQLREALAEHLRRCPYLPPSLAGTLASELRSARLPARAGWSDREGRLGKGAIAQLFQELGGEEGPEVAVDRASRLPLTVVHHAVTRFSEALRDWLIERHSLPRELAEEMILHGRERALTGAMTAADPESEVDRLAARLADKGALTPTLLLRSLCLGHLRFYEAAMAQLAGVTRAKVRARVYDGGARGLPSLYKKTGLPSRLFRAFRAAMEVIRQLGPERAGQWRRDYTNSIIARLVSEYEQVCPEDLEHVLSQLSRGLCDDPAPLREATA